MAKIARSDLVTGPNSFPPLFFETRSRYNSSGSYRKIDGILVFPASISSQSAGKTACDRLSSGRRNVCTIVLTAVECFGSLGLRKIVIFFSLSKYHKDSILEYFMKRDFKKLFYINVIIFFFFFKFCYFFSRSMNRKSCDVIFFFLYFIYHRE